MQPKVRMIIIAAVLVTASLFGVYWITQYLQRSRASATAPTASFVISGPKVNPGESFDLTLQLNPNLTPFYAFDLAFTYDPAKVSFKIEDPANIGNNIAPLSTKGAETPDITLLRGVSSTNIDTTAHVVRITGLRVNGATDPFTGRDPLKFVKVSFVMNAGAVLPLDFKWVDPNPAEINGSDSFEKINLSYTGEVEAASNLTPYACGADDFSGVASTTNFSDTFAGTTLNPTNWTVWTDVGGAAVVKDGGLSISIPAGAKTGSTAVFPKKEIEGDFTAEVTLKGHSTVNNKLTSNLAIIIRNTSWSKHIEILKPFNKSPGEINFYWFDGKNNDIGKSGGIEHNTPVKVKIERIGATISMYYDNGAGFQLMKQLDGYFAGPVSLALSLSVFEPDYPGTTGVFDDFKLTQPSTINTTLWNKGGAGTAGIVNSEGKLYLPAGTKGEWTGLSPKTKASGDFSVETVLKSLSTLNNKNTGTLALYFQSTGQKEIKIGRRVDVKMLAMGVKNTDSWDIIDKDLNLTPNTPIKIKLERIGSTIKIYYDLLNGNGYQLGRTFPNFYTGEGWITIAIESEAADYPQMSGTFDDFKLTCYRATTDTNPVEVPTVPPTGGVVQPTGAYNSLTPVPTIMGSSGREGTTTKITERKDLLYINSIASYQSPFRYEQAMKLAKGTYSLRFGAKIYVRKERGVVAAIVCNETKCGTKNMGQMMYVSPVFPVKAEFSELADSFTIPDDADNKQYILRVFCEDGSECELDYITIEDAWGSQLVKNDNFQEVVQMNDPRKQPQSWEVDATANLYGSIEAAFGNNGALMINNSAK